MKKYKVIIRAPGEIALGDGQYIGMIARTGDEFTENDITPERLEKFIQCGYVEEIVSKEPKKKEKKDHESDTFSSND